MHFRGVSAEYALLDVSRPLIINSLPCCGYDKLLLADLQIEENLSLESRVQLPCQSEHFTNLQQAGRVWSFYGAAYWWGSLTSFSSCLCVLEESILELFLTEKVCNLPAQSVARATISSAW
jgi:hypothetical protein